MILRIPDFFADGYEIDIVAFIVGTIVAIIVGYASLALLMRILKGKGFYNFAFYCWAAGALVIIAQFL
jgi:undecaprenyl pyrophosphate phosphatase UppP